MILHVLGSSSKGNGYVIEYEDAFLILEAGVPFSMVQKVTHFTSDRIAGGIVSHKHGDHAKYLAAYLQRGIPFYGPSDMSISSHHYKSLHYSKDMVSTKVQEIGPFTVKGIKVYHDVETFSYIIDVGEERILFITDTYAFPYTVPKVNYLLCEANYDQNILEEKLGVGALDPQLFRRISISHMEINTTLEILRNHRKELKGVVLLHLSDSNSDEGYFKRVCENECGIPTVVAQAHGPQKINL